MTQHDQAIAGGLLPQLASRHGRSGADYPGELLRHVRADPAGTLVDLATGNGAIAIGLAGRFRRAIGVDGDAERIAALRARTRSVPGLRWSAQDPQQARFGERSLAAVTIGPAFRGMNRQLVADRAHDWLAPGGALHLFETGSVWRQIGGWPEQLRRLVQRYGGREHREQAEASVSRAGRSHEAVLESARFSVRRIEAGVTSRWTPGQLLGHLRADPFTCPEALGTGHEGFERDVLRAVEPFLRAGRLDYEGEYTLLIGEKSG